MLNITNGTTALMIAAKNGHTEVAASTYKEAGADFNAKHN